MDDFGFDRTELTGTLLTLEFGAAGRIQTLWASDPDLPEEGEDFQFVLGSVNFGEEFAEDYFPGTILVGARMNADEPWMLSRSTDAEVVGEDPSLVEFEYELGLLPELRLTGKFYEIAGPLPQIAWDIRIANRGRQSIEIGELAFPFALNNLYAGFGRTEKRGNEIWKERVFIEKFIGGSASYLFAQRLNGEPPGLLIYPGDDTSWEFFSSAPSSLGANFQWQGIPIVYIHSRAAIEREGWSEWENGHSSLFLEPGDSRTYQLRLMPSDRDRFDAASAALVSVGHPSIKLLPSAVAPMDVGIGMEVAGSTPTQFRTSKPADCETDSDEEGGFCFVRPRQAGPMTVSFDDTKGRTSHAHLYFTEPIEHLIQKRADWILAHQVYDEPTSSLDGAILLTNSRTGQVLVHPDEYSGPFAVEGGLADALFLAEKNTIFPDRNQIHALDSMIDRFVRDDLQNPGDSTVGSAFADTSGVALNYARPHVYPLVSNLYHAMYRVARTYGETRRSSREYLHMAQATIQAMLRSGIPRQGRWAGFPGYARVFELLSDLHEEGMLDEFERLMPMISHRAEDLLKREFPFALDGGPDSSVFEEVFTAARHMHDDRHLERSLRFAYALRSLAPSWWWYGSDNRQWDAAQHGEFPIASDNGELCQGYTGPENSLMFFETLDRDYSWLPEAYLRAAFGGMLGSWALVKSDGAASMAYCPDAASKHFGFNALTGDIGMALFHYLRATGSYVLPSRTYGVFTFGCHFEIGDGEYSVRPWDGVGRRVVLRQIGAEFNLSIGRIRELRLDARKRWARIMLENPADKDLRAELRIRGLWGRKFRILGETVEAHEGELAVALPLAAHEVSQIEIQVIE